MSSPKSPENGERLEEGRRDDGLLTTGDMARLSNSTLRTVRFYEEAGILQPVQRTEGGHRLFARRELDRLRLVGDLRSAGFALDEIKAMLDTKAHCASGAEASREVLARIDAQVRSMSERIALLERVRGELASARDRLAECGACEDDDHFPDACRDCRVMLDGEAVPQAARVLWNLGR